MSVTSQYTGSTGFLLPLPARIVGYIFLILGIMAIASAAIIGIFLILLGGIAGFLQAGTAINFEDKLIRSYVNILGVKMGGTWKALPSLSRVTITPSNVVYTQNLPMGGAATTSKDTSFHINLKPTNAPKSIFIAKHSSTKAFEEAKLIAECLQIDLLDCRTREKKLIKYQEV